MVDHLDASDDHYFHTNPEPLFLKSHINEAQQFISHHSTVDPSRRLVLVTSGGTTVPLETNMVRFVDNFSAGTRGATSAEWFLRQGYAVIFLHREFSLLPFARHYSHSSGSSFLDFLEPASSADGPVSGSPGNGNGVGVRAEYSTRMASVLTEYTTARQQNMLLLLPFTTVNDYLWSLRGLARLMRPLGGRALFYLAAAVSDFFIPRRKMVEHKIQSSDEFQQQYKRSDPDADAAEAEQAATIADGKLIVHLDPVPKFLRTLVESWSPQGMIVSFKLETDPGILTVKARHALEKYGHHLVIGNLLSTRKWEVVFVSRTGDKLEEQWIRVPLERRTKSFSGIMGRPAAEALVEQQQQQQQTANGQQSNEPKTEIESLMVPKVAGLHDIHVRRIESGT